MKYYYGDQKKKNYFEGWYFKQQIGNAVLALIPGIQMDKDQNRTAFIQVITNKKSYYISYPFSSFFADTNKLEVRIDKNYFSEKEMVIDINHEDLLLKGKIEFGDFKKISGDIMGPLRLLPLMECRHGIISMTHSLKGKFILNNEEFDFTGGKGYIEKDFGRSFPESYHWTQCHFGSSDSIVIASAKIPYLKCKFKGFFAVILWEGKEYRLATYLGGKIKASKKNKIVLAQRDALLIAELLEDNHQALKAPFEGSMSKVIHESASCKVRYQFFIKSVKKFDFISDEASFEFVSSL